MELVFDSLQVTLLFLSILQLAPVAFALRFRSHFLIAMHLGGFFVFTTWQKFRVTTASPLYDATVKATDALLLCTVLLLLGYGAIAQRSSRRIVPPVLCSDMVALALALALLLLSLLPSATPFKVPVLTLQAGIGSLLVINQGRNHVFGKTAVLIFTVLFFLRHHSTQAGFEMLIASSALLFFFFRRSTLIWGSLLLLIVISLELNKSVYRRLIRTTSENSSLAQQVSAFVSSAGTVSGREGYVPRVRMTKGIFGREVPLVIHSPRLGVSQKLPDKLSRKFTYRNCMDLGIQDNYYSFIIKYSALLATPTGFIDVNSLPFIYRPTRGFPGELERSLTRIGDDSMVKVFFLTPRTIPFSDIHSYSHLLEIPIPRILWLEKPNTTFWNRFGKKYQLFEGTDNSTSISFTYLTEAYINLGFRGMLVVALLFGCFLGFIERVAGYMKSTNQALLLILVAAAICPPLESYSILSKLYQRLIFFILVQKYSALRDFLREFKSEVGLRS